MTLVFVILAFLAGLTVCYWKRTVIHRVVSGVWVRPPKEPVDQVASRLTEAADRLESVTAELASTVSALQKNGATPGDLSSPGHS